MIFISIFMILLLIGVTLWLWHLSQAQLTHFDVLMTESSMTVGRSVSKLSFSHLKEAVSLLRLRHFKREEVWFVEEVEPRRPDGSATIHRKRIPNGSEQREQVMGDASYSIGNISNSTVSGIVQGENNRVVASLSAASQPQLAQALTTLTQAVLSSRDLPADEKEDPITVINQIGKEAAEPKPNKALLKILVNGLLTMLETIPDVANTVRVVAPILNQLQDLVTQPDFPAGKEVQIQGGEPQQVTGSTKTIVPTPLTARYSGTARLPKKVYEGDSQNISLILDRKLLIQGLRPETLNIEDTAVGKQVTLDIQNEDNREQFLEVELLAVALSIDGEKKQKQSLTLEKLTYQWNCQCKSAGNHEICLVLKVVHPSGERSLGRIEQTIRVVKFDHATQHQVQIGAAVTGAVALLGTAATLLSTVLGLWHLPYK